MLTGRQKVFLRGMANSIDSLTQIGKGGVTEAFIKQADRLLDDHELVKITVLESCEMTAKEALTAVCEPLGAEPVQAIGRKIIIFRQNEEEPVIKLP